MRPLFFLILLLSFTGASAQRSPGLFEGHWEGTLTWFKGAEKDPRLHKMQLKVFPADTAGQFTWQIIYGEDNKDNRPYLIKPVDTLKGHWVIDEKNGIFLDQYFIGGKMCGSFSVGEYRINNCYWLEKDELIVEFMTTSEIAVTTSGGASEEIPKVRSYTVHGHQKAILKRRK